MMDPTTRRVLRQALAAIDAAQLPAAWRERLLQELRARFPDLPEAHG